MDFNYYKFFHTVVVVARVVLEVSSVGCCVLVVLGCVVVVVDFSVVVAIPKNIEKICWSDDR